MCRVTTSAHVLYFISTMIFRLLLVTCCVHRLLALFVEVNYLVTQNLLIFEDVIIGRIRNR
jgi:hypothetical protein